MRSMPARRSIDCCRASGELRAGIGGNIPVMNAAHEYVHGYSSSEDERLVDQATTLTGLLHYDTIFPAGSRVLEAVVEG